MDAAQYYERALDVSRRIPGFTDADRAILWSTLGEVRELAGMLEESVDAFRRAAHLTVDPVARAEQMARWARVHERSGEPRRSLRIISLARKLLVEAPGPEADAVGVKLDLLVANVRLGQERPREAGRYAERAAEGARLIEDGEGLARALTLIDHARWQLGVPIEGNNFREALEIFTTIGHLLGQAVVREALGAVAFNAGRWVEALDWYASSVSADRKAGMELGAAETELNIAEIFIYQGYLEEAEETLTSAMRVLQASGVEYPAAWGQILRARLHLIRGDLDGADRAAESAEKAFGALGSLQSVFEAALLRADVANRRGESDVALQIVAQAELEARGEDLTALQAQRDPHSHEPVSRWSGTTKLRLVLTRGLEAALSQNLPYEQAQLLKTRATLEQVRGGARAAEWPQLTPPELTRSSPAWGSIDCLCR